MLQDAETDARDRVRNVRAEDKRGNVNRRGAGGRLKATGGWGKYNSERGENWNGTDDYGFSALPGGYLCGDSCYGSGYFGAGDDNTPSSYESGEWWTATPAPRENGYEQAFYLSEHYGNKDDGYSVRCVTDK